MIQNGEAAGRKSIEEIMMFEGKEEPLCLQKNEGEVN